LCLSIFLEAIQRFIEPQEVSQPQLVLIVGCFGLASNIIGLFLFHEHGHSHGDHGQPHVRDDTARAAEEGRLHDGCQETEAPNADESETTATRIIRTRSKSRTYSGLDEIPIHPASFRHEIIQASRLEDFDDASGEEVEHMENEDRDFNSFTSANGNETLTPVTENTSLLSKTKSNDNHHRTPSHSSRRKSSTLHRSDKHTQHKSEKKSHGDLNIRGVFLHVMGDALGNVGVIATALFIWLTDFWWRFYSDPLVSLIITVIILYSALPLCRAASRILLQAVPQGLNVDDIRDDIENLPGILSCHHLHVWQLNDTSLIATLHVRVAFEFKGEGSQKYMELAHQIRECLHKYGIHSSTIQPEFCCERTHGHRLVQHHDDGVLGENDMGLLGDHGGDDQHDRCILDCDDECGDGGKCCWGNGRAHGGGRQG
jgi:zinc transporter 1